MDQGRTRYVVAAVVALVGLIFIAQGLGLDIAHSVMTGDLRWTAVGLVMVVLAGVYAARGMRRPR
jgi:cytochrome c oxidase subunit IV